MGEQLVATLAPRLARGIELLLASVELRRRIVELLLGGSTLALVGRHAVAVLRLAIRQLALAVRNLGRRIGQFGLGVGQLAVCLGLLAVVLVPLFVELFLGLTPHVIAPLARQLGAQVLKAPLGRVDHPLVGVGLAQLLARAAHGEVDLGVGRVLCKRCRSHKEVLVDHARAKVGRAKAAGIGVVGRADRAHDGELVHVEQLGKVARAVQELHRVTDAVVGPRDVGAHHALAPFLWPAPVHQAGPVEVVVIVGGHGIELIRHAVARRVRVDRRDAHGHLLGTQARHGVAGQRGHNVLDPLDRTHALHIVIREAQRRDEAHVPEVGAIVEGVGVGAHVGTTHLQARVEPAAQSNDAHDGQKAAHRPADAAYYVLGKGTAHGADLPL